MIKKFLIFALILGVISACTIRTNIHFNEDWSGNLEYILDMSAMTALLDDTTARESLLDDPDVNFSVSDFEKMEGVSNVKLNENLETGMYSFSLDFANVAVLNEIIAGEDPFTTLLDASKTESNQNSMKFDLKKQKLGVQMIDFKDLNKMSGETEGYMEGMGSLITYEINLSFDRKIKKFKTKGSAQQVGLNEVKFDVNFGELENIMETDQSFKLVLE